MQKNLGLLVLRLGAGAMLFTHGWSKWQRIFAGDLHFSNPIGLGPVLSLILVAFAEGVCSLAVIAGFKTRWSAIPPVIAMTVAAFVRHAGDPFSSREKALSYLVMFLTLALLGGGGWSIDAWMRRRRTD